MIIARSPLRISFAGGGTDLPAFYEKYGPGAVVSTSIDKHVYVSIGRKFGGGVSLRYRVIENHQNASEIEHPLVREILKGFGVDDGVEIVISSDVPARGSGLGASSALACALVAALDRFTNSTPVEAKGEEGEDYRAGIAERAAMFEIQKVGSPIGKQDHYSSSLGGVNFIQFNADGSVNTEKFRAQDFVDEIEGQSMLFYLDIGHTYKDGPAVRKDTKFVQKILHDQVLSMDRTHKVYELQRDNAIGLWKNMAYEVPERFIDHVNENWRLKRSTHPEISNQIIDAVIQKAYEAGATAAKVCGAGGGGFLYLMVPPYMQGDVRRALTGLQELRFGFDKTGVEVVFDGRGKESKHVCV